MALLSSGCGSSVRIDAKPVTELASPQASLPPELAVSCPRPIDLSAGPLSAGAVERAWGQDRAELLSCGARFDAALTFYRTRDNGLAGNPEVKK